MSRSWYVFIGDNPTNALNYYRINIKHTCLCGDKICAIYAYDGGINPKEPLSPNLQVYISKALLTGQLQPDIPWDTKKYVYLKN